VRTTHIYRTLRAARIPLLLVLFFLFHGYAEQYPLLPPNELFPTLLRYATSVILICFVLQAWFKQENKTSLFTFLLLSIQFFFGAVSDLLKSIPAISFVASYRIILPLILLTLIAAALWIRRSKRSLHRVVIYLGILLLILITTDAVMLLFKKRERTNTDQTALLRDCPECPKPDIFIIVADGYAGREELEDLFAYDNRPFENELRKRGFRVVDSSRSNYPFTIYSLSSFLNLGLHENITGQYGHKKDLAICREAFRNAGFIHYLKRQGYEVYNYSVFPIGGEAPRGRTSVIPVEADRITGQTLTSRLLRDLGYHLITTVRIPFLLRKAIYTDDRNNNTYIDAVREQAARSGGPPRLVYTHIMMPHYPYYRDSLGNELPMQKLTPGSHQDKSLYLSYLKYANRRYLALIDHIRRSSSGRAVIFFLSDHGFREFGSPVEDRYLFMNIQAIHAPGIDSGTWYKGLTPVNTIRLFLNRQFKQQLPLLPDTTLPVRE
jgi:hypothetical protein